MKQRRPLDWSAHLPPGMAIEQVDLLVDASLPGRWIRRWRERSPWPQLCAPDGRWISSTELEQRTRTAAARMRASGLAPGCRIALCAGTSVELVVAYIAALRAGLVVVPLNPAYTRAEIKAIAADARLDAALVEDRERGRWIASASPETAIHPVNLSSLAADGQEASLDGAAAGDPALLMYTSGTTGQPKGALLTHANLLAGATALELAWRWSPEDRLLLALPLFHMHGLGVGLNGTLCAGAALALRPRFDPGDVAEQAAGGASMFFGVPSMYQRLAVAGRLDALAQLRLVVSGSAPLAVELAREIAARAGQIPLERYGMTETVMLTSNPYAGERRPGTVGFALPGVELRLAADGEVQVRGANVFAGYDRNQQADAQAFSADGWFRTGDVGELDADGYLRLVGRSKELIISGGFNVYPREVEEALMSHPAVLDAAVVGRPSERWGEEVTAVVVAAQEVEPEQLRAHAACRLAPYKVPKRIEFAKALPRNAMGKILRERL